MGFSVSLRLARGFLDPHMADTAPTLDLPLVFSADVEWKCNQIIIICLKCSLETHWRPQGRAGPTCSSIIHSLIHLTYSTYAVLDVRESVSNKTVLLPRSSVSLQRSQNRQLPPGSIQAFGLCLGKQVAPWAPLVEAQLCRTRNEKCSVLLHLNSCSAVTGNRLKMWPRA